MEATILGKGRCGILDIASNSDVGCSDTVIRIRATGYPGIGRMKVSDAETSGILYFNSDGTPHTQPVGASDKTMRRIWQDAH